MRFIASDRFDVQFKRLPREHQRLFIDCVREKFDPACDDWAHAMESGASFIWPARLRIARIVGASGILEMTWSFTAPDGRATFELVKIGNDWTCKWRRIADLGIYRDP